MKIMEMICYNVKILIVLSALCTGTYALHMVRDSYHRPMGSQAQAQADYHHHSKNDGHQQRLMVAENEPSSSSLSVADGTILFHSAIPNKLSTSKYTDYNMFNKHNVHQHNSNYNQNIDADENGLRKVDGLNQHIPASSLTSKMQLQHPPSHHYKLTKSPVSIPMFDIPSTSLDIRFKSDNIYDGQPKPKAHTVLLNHQQNQKQESINQPGILQQQRGEHQLSNSLVPQEQQHHQQQPPERHLKEQPQSLEKLFQNPISDDNHQHRQLDNKPQKLPMISHQGQQQKKQPSQQQKRSSTLNRYYGHPYTEYDDGDDFDNNEMGNVINGGGGNNNNNRDHADDVEVDDDDDVEVDGIGGLMDRSDIDTKSFQSSLTHDMVNQHMYRNNRGQRQYDVPQVECPPAVDGMERFACPKPDRTGRYRCIDDHVLCDGFLDCPMGEDEDRMACMFYKTTKAHLDVLADALLRWARGR